MASKNFTVSFEPSAYNVKTLAYAVNPNAQSAEVKAIQIANKSNNTHNVDVFWVEYKLKENDYAVYYGDGSTHQQYYTYPTSSVHTIIQNAEIPKGAALNVLSSPLYLEPKDFIYIRPSTSGSGDVFSPTVIVNEEFYDDTYTHIKVDLSIANNEILSRIY